MRSGLVSFRMSTDGDHSKAVKDIAKMGIPCFMLRETAQALKFEGHRLSVIEPLHQVEIGGFSVMPFPLEHEDVNTGKRVPNVGFLVSDGTEKLMFATDTFYIKHRFEGLNTIAIGINWSKRTLNPKLDPARKKRLYRSHMSLETALKFFKANDLSKVREIHILHISSENGDSEYFKSEIQKLTGKPVYV